MAIGTLAAKIVLDNPERVHYGPEDPVTGRIILTFTPSAKTRQESNPELFGPLKVAVTFHGRSKSKIWKKQGNNTHIYRGRAPLFSRSKVLYDDSYRARPNQPHYFRFELYFPQGADARDLGDWPPDRRFNFKRGDPLPPSFNSPYRGFAHRHESFVEYRVGVDVAMQGLQISISKPDKYGEAIVYYEQTPLLQTIREQPIPWKGSASVKNELLLPEEDRPTGFRQKAKAAFTDYYPTYSFDYGIISPQHLYIGQPIAFEVYIRPREQESTAVVIPEVHLNRLTVEVKACTEVRAEKQLWSTPESSGSDTQITLNGVPDNGGPFSKANNWSKTINTKEIRGLTSAFQTVNISHRYTMKVKCEFIVAGKTKDFTQGCSVTLHPPLLTADLALSVTASSAVVAGSSARPYGMQNMEAALPQYERPPEYEDTVAESSKPLVVDEQAKLVQ